MKIANENKNQTTIKTNKVNKIIENKIRNKYGVFIIVLFVLVLLAGFVILFPSGCSKRPVERGVFYTAGNWDIPPAYHGNPWAPGGVGVAGPYVHEPLFVYLPRTQEYIARLGESFTESDDHKILTVQLKTGVQWHDGQSFSSKDVKTTFYIGYLKRMEIWGNLEDIECPDDNTVVFKWKKVSPTNTIRALTEPITSPYHIFGKWADMVPEIRTQREAIGETDTQAISQQNKSEQKVLEVLYMYHPDMPIGTGPFKIQKVTSSDILLSKFEDYYEKDNVKIDKVRIQRWGSNEVVWSYLMGGEVDAVTPACPYDVAQEILRRNPGMKIMTPSDMSEFGLIFNCRKNPTGDINFRKAIAHILNRDTIRQVAYYYGDTVDDYSLGVVKSFRDKWLSKDFYNGLTLYDCNEKKAEEILLSAGYSREPGTQKWLDPDKKPLSLEIVSPSGVTDLTLLSEVASAQLNKFGISTQIRVVPGDLYITFLQDGKFDLAAENGTQMTRYGHPVIGLNRFYYKGAIINMASGLPIELKGRSGSIINTDSLVKELNITLEPQRRDEIVQDLAWVTNEYLPFLTCYEKRIIIFILDSKRVTGFPSSDDKIWDSAPGGVENLYCTMMVKGMIRPAGESEEENKFYYKTMPAPAYSPTPSPTPTPEKESFKPPPNPGRELQYGIWKNDTEKIKLLLNHCPLQNYGVVFRLRKDKGWSTKGTPLHWACLTGNKEMVEILLDKKSKLEARDSFDKTPLRMAVSRRHKEIVELLLEKGADVNSIDREDQMTPLHEAVSRGDYQIAELLINQKANLNIQDAIGWTPLHQAIWYKENKGEIFKLDGGEKDSQGNWVSPYAPVGGDEDFTKTIILLIAKGSDINQRDYMGKTPFHMAVESGDQALVKLLLSYKADPTACTHTGKTALHLAVLKGNLSMTLLLLEKGVNLSVRDHQGSTLLHLSPSPEITRLLLSKGMDINSKNSYGETPLHSAVLMGYNDVIRELLNKGAGLDIRDNQGQTPLHICSQWDNLAIVELLLSNGANPDIQDQEKWTPLHWAVYSNSQLVAEKLISYKANLRIRDQEGRTPLHIAGIRGKEEMISILAREGGHLDEKDSQGNTPLHLACLYGNRNGVQTLLCRGADYKIKNPQGNTPLHLSCSVGRKDITELLISRGADYKEKNLKGDTPIHLASSSGNRELVLSLIGRGVDLSSKNIYGKTPLHSAVESNHQEIAELLISKGAKVNEKDHKGNTPLKTAYTKGYGKMAQLLRKYGGKS